MLGAPELDTGLQVGSDESRVKEQNPPPRPAAHAALDAAQGTGGFLGCQRFSPVPPACATPDGDGGGRRTHPALLQHNPAWWEHLSFHSLWSASPATAGKGQGHL